MADEIKKSGTRDDLVQSGTRPRDGDVDYRIIFDANSNGMAFTEADSGRIIDVNAAWLAATGFVREEAIGKTALELGLWPDPARRATCYAELQKKGLLTDFEASLVFKSVEIPHLVSARFFEMDDKRYVLWEFRNIAGQKQSEAKIAALLAKSEQSRRSLLSMLQDMKQAEEALKESEEKYRNLVERANDGICILQDAILRYVNPQLAHMTGYSPEEVTGRPFSDFSMPEEVPKVVEHYKRRMAGEDVPPVYETALRHKDDSRIDVEFNAGITIYEGKPADLVFVRDITERKRVEEALKESEIRFRTLFEAIPDTVLVHDDEGTILHINEIGAQKLECSAKDLEGRNLREIVTLDNAVSIANHVRKTHKAGWSIFETTYVARSGWQIMAEVHERPIKFGGVKAILSVARDITDRKRTEEALRTSEQHYRILFEESLDGICLADVKTGIIVDCNQALAALVCRERAGLIGKPQTILHPLQDDKAAFSSTFKQHQTDKEGQILETQVVTSTGDIREVEIKANLHDLQGKKLLQGLFHDITERKRAEKELQESEERFRLAFENANIGVCLVDLEGNLTRVNAKMCEIFGYTKEELEHMTVNAIAHPEDINTSPTFMKNALEGKTASGAFEKRYIHKKGHVVTCEVASSLVRDAEGSSLYFIFHLRDITDRKQAERELEEEREREKRYLDIAGVIILVTDTKGEVTLINRKGCEILGYAQEEIIGKRWIDNFIPPRIRDDVNVIEHMMMTGQIEVAAYHENNLMTKGGAERLISWHNTLLRDGQGGITGVLASGTDITDRKQAEDEVKHGFEQLRETFISTVNALASTVELKDQYTAGHQPRATQLACAIAAEMGLPDEQIEGIRMAGSLHDIGKIVVPAEILNKPGPLSEIQYEMVKMHPQAGYDVLKAIKFPWPVAQLVLQHHELMNGSGYPQGLSGDEIIPEARILTVANVVEAMTAHRPYRPAHDITEALAEIAKNRGILYDPAAVDACLRLFAEKRFTFN